MKVVLCVLVLLWMSACAGLQDAGRGGKLEAGQTASELVAQKGQPQDILPQPQGEKIYIYTTYRLDQMAGMGGGVWGKPQETHYHIDDKGIITQVEFYPYGKRTFIFPREKELRAKETAASPQKTAPPVEQARASTTSPVLAQGARPPEESQPKALPPAAPAMEAASRLELNMNKEEVRRLLGLPNRTEGFFSKGKPLVIWFYAIRDNQGKPIVLPLVFQEERLIGWGERYYQQLDIR